MKRNLLLSFIIILLFQINTVRSQIQQNTYEFKNFIFVNYNQLTLNIIFTPIDSDDLIMVENDIYNYLPGVDLTNLIGEEIIDIDDLTIGDNNASNLTWSKDRN